MRLWIATALAAASLATPALAADSAHIPLQAGLRIVTALNEPSGDTESVKQITSVDGGDVAISYQLKKNNIIKRIVSRDDLESAHEYAAVFSEKLPELIPGTTSLGTSKDVIDELVNRGQTEFSYHGAVLIDKQGNLTNIVKTKGILKFVDYSSISVLVDGERISLPAIHAKGQFDGQGAEFYFLNDPANPLALRFSLAYVVNGALYHSLLQTVRIDTGSFNAGRLTTSLEQAGRVELPGIYFETNKADLRSESDDALRVVAETLASNPDWRLRIEGHTDNIGSDAYNLELSKRRAAAVKNALVARYGVAADRLSTTGYGASRPKETNDTLDGRARNRRVELVRL